MKSKNLTAEFVKTYILPFIYHDNNRRYIDTKRFSPVIYERDLPADGDLFHYKPDEVPYLSESDRAKFMRNNDIIIDDVWWDKQKKRCEEGYIVKNATNYGEDIWIPGRMYFFLNFWSIKRKGKDGRKRTGNPRFIDMGYEKFFLVRELSIFMAKDNMWQKARQLGYSEMAGCDIGYEFTFFRDSQSVVVSGEEKYTFNLMNFIIRGLKYLSNTQFHIQPGVYRKTEYISAKYRGSEIYGRTAKNNAEAVSSLSPSLIYFEETGIWADGVLSEAYGFVIPSLVAENIKTGFGYFVGCVCKGTKVYDNDGAIVNVEDLDVNKGIIGFNSLGIVKDNIIHYNPPQKKQCYRITTKKGGVIECSFDHPFLITNSNTFYAKRKYVNRKRVHVKTYKRVFWQEAKDLKIGDRLSKPGKIDLFGKKRMWNPRLVGMLIGDGSYGLHRTPVLSNCDYEVLKYAKKTADCVIEKTYFTQELKVYEEIRIRGISKELINIGISGQTKHKKRLPDNLHEYNKRDLAKMIAGLYDTDGYLGEGTSEFKGLFLINITQLSKELIYQLKSLLLRFGIDSNVSLIKPRNRERIYRGNIIKDVSDYYILQIANKNSLLLFAENFKLLIKYKQRVLDYIKENAEKTKYNTVVQNVNTIGKKAILFKYDDIYFEKIVSIEDIGEQDVYNLTTKNTHTYLANDFITHNTGGDQTKGVKTTQKMFYEPRRNDLLEFDNVYEVGATEAKVCCFSPAFYFEIIDEEGNSLIPESIEKIKNERKEKSLVERYRYITQKPFTPTESFLTSMAGYFGEEIIQRLNERKAFLLGNPSKHTHVEGYLKWLDPSNKHLGVEFIESTEETWCNIFEFPKTDSLGEVLLNLYKSGTDSYDQDEAHTSTSEGSIQVYKGFNNINDTYNKYVARITERPREGEGGASRFFEWSLMLSIYFNVVNLIEFSKILIIHYFVEQGFEYLLKEKPEFFLSTYVENSKSSNRWGIDPSTKPVWLVKMRDWLTPENIEKMDDIRQIEALAKFKYDPSGKKYNCDITISSSLCQVVAYDDQDIPVSESESDEEESYGVYFKMGRNGSVLQTI
jgi:intein/homing endonuclease